MSALARAVEGGFGREVLERWRRADVESEREASAAREFARLVLDSFPVDRGDREPFLRALLGTLRTSDGNVLAAARASFGRAFAEQGWRS